MVILIVIAEQPRWFWKIILATTSPELTLIRTSLVRPTFVQSIGQIESNDMHMISNRYDLTSLGSLQGHPATLWISVY